MIIIGKNKVNLSTKEEIVKVMVDNYSNLTGLLYNSIHNPEHKRLSINESLFLIAIMEDVQKIEDYLDDLESTDKKMKYLDDNVYAPVLIEAIVRMEEYLETQSINIYSIVDTLKKISNSFYILDNEDLYGKLYGLYEEMVNNE